MKLDTVADVMKRLHRPAIDRLPAPKYTGTSGERRIGLAVPSMRDHTTSEGWEMFLGLGHGGYTIAGHGMRKVAPDLVNVGAGFYLTDVTDVKDIVDGFKPDVIVVQDKREYEGKTAGKGFDERERFINVRLLSSRESVFKGTILKDAQHNPMYHRESALEIGCHFWVAYYHPRVVCHLAPFVREEHVVRTYHTVDVEKVPPFRAFGIPKGANDRKLKALLSGAISGAYPMRQRVLSATRTSKAYQQAVDVLPHPGYGRTKCYTPEYLQILSRYRVAICTSSVYGYALRKLVEATVCGCVVITDLPVDDVLPGIDGNLVRVPHTISNEELLPIIEGCIDGYNPDKQEFYAQAALTGYDYRVVGSKLAADIETLRQNYNAKI